MFALPASIIAGIGVSLFTTPPPEQVVAALFDAAPSPSPSVG
jgi:hypothetical protein